MKFVPLSLVMRDGQPRLATNLIRAAMNDPVDRSVTASMCTVCTVSDTNKQM